MSESRNHDFQPRDRSILQRVLDESDKVNNAHPEIAASSKSILERAPNGFYLAIGVGQNNDTWQSKGWHTLDRAQQTGAEYIMDANKMTEEFAPGTLDAIAVERIPINPFGGPLKNSATNEIALSYEGLLKQAHLLLKKGGKLILIGADLGKYDTKYHFHSGDMQELFKRYGFLAVLETDDNEDFLADDMVGTTWYAQKN